MSTGKIVYLSEVPPVDSFALFDEAPEVLTVSKVGELPDVHPQTVRREIARGKLGCIHVGKAVRVTKRQLLQYVGEVDADD